MGDKLAEHEKQQTDMVRKQEMLDAMTSQQQQKDQEENGDEDDDFMDEEDREIFRKMKETRMRDLHDEVKKKSNKRQLEGVGRLRSQ